MNEPPIGNEVVSQYTQHGKSKPGLMILSGTQLASISIAFLMFIIHIITALTGPIKGSDRSTANDPASATFYIQAVFVLAFFYVHIIITNRTYTMIKNSGGSQ